MIHILTGDIYLIKQEKRIIVDKFLEKNDVLAIEELNFDKNSQLDMGDLIALVQSDSLFFSDKLIILNNISEVFSSDKLNIKHLEHIQILFDSVTTGVTLLIVEFNLNKNHPLVKIFKQQKNYIDFQAYTGFKLQNWLIDQAKQYQCDIGQAEARYLIQKTGEDLVTLYSELTKLAAHNQITIKLIDELVIDNQEVQIFNLIDALFKKQYNKAINLYNQQINQGNQPIQILGAIVWQLQLIAITKSDRRSIDILSKEYSIHRFPLQKSKTLAGEINWEHLNTLLSKCTSADYKIRCEFIDSQQVLMHLIVSICNYSRKA